VADVNANIGVNIDSSQALAQLKALQRQISEFHGSVAKSSEAAALAQKSLQKNLVSSINSLGSFSAELRTVNTTAESFTKALENNKLSMREYFRYAAASTKTFGQNFKAEYDTIGKVAEERVKTLQTQFIKMGRDANGAMKAIAVRPLALDMDNLSTKTQIAAQKQAIFNQLMKQGSTNLLNFGKNTQWAGRQLMVGFTLPLAAFGSTAAKAFQQLETEVIKFTKVYGDLGTSKEQTDQALKNIKALAEGYTQYGVEVSKTVGLASQAAAAGFQGADLIAQTDAATKLAILGQIEQQQALETTISLQNAFKISSTELATTIDFLNAVENQTVTSLDDITTAIPKVAPVIQSLGGDVKDLAFFLTAMKEGGVNASEGANALKSGLASLINPTNKATALLGSMGINIDNIVTKNKGNLKATVVEFATALDQLDPLARARAIETMFGKFQFARISTLLSNVIESGNQASRVLDLAGQSTSDLANLTSKELGITAESALVRFQGAVAKLKSSLAPVGEVFMKAFVPVVDFISNLLDRFNGLSEGTKKFVAITAGVIGGLGPILLMTFGLLANGIANILKLFMTLRAGFQRLTGSSQNLGEQTQYLTTEQLTAAAAAHSLEQSHARLTQQFTAEASEVFKLRNAYQQALAAGASFASMNPGMMRTPRKFATGGIFRGPGNGTSDSIPAMVSNGEAIIPAATVKKYPGMVSGLISGNIPGFKKGFGIERAHATGAFNPESEQYQAALDMIPGLRDLYDKFPSMIRVVSDLTAELPKNINQAMKVVVGKIGGADISNFEQGYGSLANKFYASAKRGGADIEDQEVAKALNAFEDAVGKRTVELARQTKNQKVTDELFEKATREVIDEYMNLEGAAKKAATALDISSKKVGQVRIQPSQDTYRRGLASGDFVIDETGKVAKYKGITVARTKRNTAAGLPASRPASNINMPGNYTTGEDLSYITTIGIRDGREYSRSVKQVAQDPYVVSRDRKSPHRLAPKDGEDDGRAYSTAVQKSIARHERKLAKQSSRLSATSVSQNIVASPETKRQWLMSRMFGRRQGGSLISGAGILGGAGMMAGSMALSALPDFAGKAMVQSSMNLASMGSMFGPWGAAAGAAVGLVTSSLSALIAKQKEHAAVSKATFGAASSAVTFFGDKVLDTNLKINSIGVSIKGVTNGFGNLNPEIAAFVKYVNELPEDNPLKVFVDNLKEMDTKSSLTGNIRAKVASEIALGGMDPAKAKQYVAGLLEAAGKSNQFAEVWASISPSIKDAGTATETLVNKVVAGVGPMESWYFAIRNADGSTKNLVRSYDSMSDSQKAVADTLKGVVGALASGTLNGDQFKIRMDALKNSALNTSLGLDILQASIYASGDAGAKTVYDGIIFSLDQIGQKTTVAVAGLIALKNLGKTDQEIAAALGEKYDPNLPMDIQSMVSTSRRLRYVESESGMEAITKKAEEYRKAMEELTGDGTGGGKGTGTSSDILSKEAKLTIARLQKELDALKTKRDLIKDSNDELKRQYEYQQKIMQLQQSEVQARITGNYIQASMIRQQQAFTKTEYNKETESIARDKIITNLENRISALSAGEKITAAERALNKAKAKANGMATGGHVVGPGSGTSDSIPAMLSSGEYVIKASAVNQYGKTFFDGLNAQKFANGGEVESYKNVGMPNIFGMGMDWLGKTLFKYGNLVVKNALGFDITKPMNKKSNMEILSMATLPIGVGGRVGKGTVVGAKAVKNTPLLKYIMKQGGDIDSDINVVDEILAVSMNKGKESVEGFSELIHDPLMGSTLNALGNKAGARTSRDLLALSLMRGASAGGTTKSGIGLVASSDRSIYAETLVESLRKRGLDGIIGLPDRDLSTAGKTTESAKAWLSAALKDRSNVLNNASKAIEIPEEAVNTARAALSELLKNGYDKKIFSGFVKTFNKQTGIANGFAAGGIVSGPGNGTSDLIPAMLSNGEYVMRAKAVQNYGVDFMNSINGQKMPVSNSSAQSISSVYNIDMTINGGSANANEIADQVMRKLKVVASQNNKSNKVVM